MSRSALRLLTLVVVVGGVLVSVLLLVGQRTTQRHARKPSLTPRTIAVFGPRDTTGERPVPAPMVSPALLPTIAAAQQRQQERIASGERPPVEAAPAARDNRPTEPHLAPDIRQVFLRRQFEKVLANHPQVELAFVNCEENDCRVRAESRDRAMLKAFLKDARTLPLTMQVHLETHSSAFNGTSYRADLEGPVPAPSSGG